MQFTGKLTEAELAEMQKLTLPKMYWPKLLLANWYGFGLIAAITWATISGFLGQTKPSWRAMGVIWLVIAGIVLWSVFRTKQERARDLAKLNATLPDRVNFTNDGVKLNGPDGASAFLPWTHFKRWREGKRVMLVEMVEGNRIVILPVAQYSEVERQPIREFLQSSVPSSSH
jgi:hypothetical protein